MKLFRLLKNVSTLMKLIDSDKYEAETIFGEVLGIERAKVFLRLDEELTTDQQNKILDIVSKRLRREPLQYILGYAYFFEEKFKVNRDVLIPRSETELLVELIFEIARKISNPSILEIGVGSGAPSIILSKKLGLKVKGVDICQNALDVANENAKAHNADVEFIKSNLFENVNGTYDIIFSNPPYVTEDEYKKLSKEVLCEPIKALVADDEGLFIYKEILSSIKQYLNRDGYLLFEMGYKQGRALKELAKNYFDDVTISRDLRGLDRILICRGLK